MFFFLLCVTGALANVWTGINNNAPPFLIPFSNNASVGPDGPWWFIPQAVNYPDQIVNMIPALSPMSILVNNSACSGQTANCPLPIPTLWSVSGAFEVADGPETASTDIAFEEFAEDMATLLRIQGSGRYIVNRMTLHNGGDATQPAFLDFHGMMLSNSYAVAYPGGASYTLDTGFFSLYGALQTTSWTSTNGSSVSANKTLPDTYTAGYIPSVSYGLHIGSVYPNVTGSLILGGYDSSRCLTQPVVGDSSGAVLLEDLALNVSSGGSAYKNLTSGYAEGLLQVDSSSNNTLEIHTNPGMPYLYLPRATCDAIAQHLPVTYNAAFNLYFWNVEDPAYEEIVTSPHYLSFIFSSGVDSTTQAVNVPFALLNLTLEAPLVSSPTPYFPCSPWDDTAVPNNLGRAFLQAAFLAQNWQTGKKYLAQAPGPDFLPANVKSIAYTDTTLAPAANPPSWESTWSGTLKALPSNQSSSSSPSSSSTAKSSSTLSGGAIAGIVVGVIVGLALVAAFVFWFMRHRKRAKWVTSTQGEHSNVYAHDGKPGAASAPPQYGDVQHEKQELHGEALVHEAEAPLPPAPVELDGGGEATELPVDQQHPK